MKSGFSVPTQGSVMRFDEVLDGVLASWDAEPLLPSRVPVDGKAYGVDEAYAFRVQRDGRTEEIGRLYFIPAGTRRNIIRVPDREEDGNGTLFDSFVVKLMGQLYRQGLVPRPPRDI